MCCLNEEKKRKTGRISVRNTKRRGENAMIRSAGFIWEQPGSARVSMEKKKKRKGKKKSPCSSVLCEKSAFVLQKTACGVFSVTRAIALRT